MNEDKSSKFDAVKAKFADVKEWVLDHTKIVMPILLVLCVAITIVIALNANKQDKLQKQAQAAALAAQTAESDAAASEVKLLEAPAYSLEENAYPEVNDLVKNYYDAMAKGDLLTAESLNPYLDDVQKIRIEEQSKFIEEYPEINIYTKPGLSEGAYVACVCSKTKFIDLETPLPGMQTYYIAKDENGNYFISDSTYDTTIYDYVSSIAIQEDVVDLNNKVVVEYNDLLSENPDIDEYVAYLKEKINEEVGVMLASSEAPETVVDQENDEETDATAAVVVTKVKAKEVVNIRESDSENAAKIDKAQTGQEFDLIEEKPNGWSEISYNGGSAFIKSEFLEAVQTVTIGNDDETQDDAATDDNTDNADNATTTSDKTNGTGKKYTVNDSGVRIRKEASTDAEIIDTLYTGTEVELVEAMSNGWSKVKYKNDLGYIKSEFLDAK